MLWIGTCGRYSVLLHGNVEHTKLSSHDRSRAQRQSKCNDAFTQRSAGRALVGTQNSKTVFVYRVIYLLIIFLREVFIIFQVHSVQDFPFILFHVHITYDISIAQP